MIRYKLLFQASAQLWENISNKSTDNNNSDVEIVDTTEDEDKEEYIPATTSLNRRKTLHQRVRLEVVLRIVAPFVIEVDLQSDLSSSLG